MRKPALADDRALWRATLLEWGLGLVVVAHGMMIAAPPTSFGAPLVAHWVVLQDVWGKLVVLVLLLGELDAEVEARRQLGVLRHQLWEAPLFQDAPDARLR